MQHTGHFDTLLRDTVNLPQARLDQLSDRVGSIYDALLADAALGDLVIGKTPQGSWAHRTIIKPAEGKEYDADVLIHLDENYDWSDDKPEYINELYRALGRAGYADRHRKTRCVRVQYANDCHIDLVPYVTTWAGAKIVNRATGEWEDTNPQGFAAWMNERDTITNGNFRKVVRLMKFLRDHKNSFTGTRSSSSPPCSASGCPPSRPCWNRVPTETSRKRSCGSWRTLIPGFKDSGANPRCPTPRRTAPRSTTGGTTSPSGTSRSAFTPTPLRCATHSTKRTRTRALGSGRRCSVMGSSPQVPPRRQGARSCWGQPRRRA